jgi:hypothetical protein
MIARLAALAVALALVVGLPTATRAEPAKTPKPKAVKLAEIAIVAPAQPIKPGKAVRLTVSGLTPDRLPACRVEYFPDEAVELWTAQTWGGEPFIVFTAEKAGKYKVWVNAHAAEGDSFCAAVLTVGTLPGPDPEPDPNPDPGPTPTPNKPAYVYLFYETGDATQQIGEMVAATSWTKAAEALGAKWLIADDDVAETRFPNAVKRARDTGLPALVLLDAKGAATVRKVQTAADILEALKQAAIRK